MVLEWIEASDELNIKRKIWQGYLKKTKVFVSYLSKSLIITFKHAS